MTAVPVAAGASPTTVATPSSWQKFIIIVNDSDTEVRLFFDGTAVGSFVLADGVPLAPRESATVPGGVFQTEQHNRYCYTFYALHGGAGNKSLVVQAK